MVPAELQFNQRGWIDFFKLTGVFTAMLIADEASSDIALGVLAVPTAKKAWREYFLRWAARKGPHEEIVSDVGGELIGREFLKEAEQQNVFKKVTAASSSESHGRVERPIKTVRWSLDRILVEEPDADRWDQSEWEVVLASLENAIRNEVIVGGSSASLRATGRTSSIHRNLLSDSPSTGDAIDDLGATRKLMDVAVKQYREVLNSDRLRRLLVQRVPSRGDETYELGDTVYYLREPESGRGARWHGPGTVTGVLEHYVHVDHGGVQLKVHVGDVQKRDVDQEVQGVSTESNVPAVLERPLDEEHYERGRAGGPSLREQNCQACRQKARGVRQSKTHTCGEHGRSKTQKMGPAGTEHGVDNTAMAAWWCELAADDSDSDDDGSWDGWLGRRRQRTYDGSKTAREPTCLLAQDDDVFGDEMDPETLTAMDAYLYEWGDLSEQEQYDSRRRGLDDYDKSASWTRGNDLTKDELDHVLTSNGKRRVLFSKTWADKTKIKGGVLYGKSRCAPRGYEAGWMSSDQTESPTAGRTTNKVADAMRRKRRMRGVIGDYESAFFSSKEIPPEDAEVWMEVPYEDADWVPGPKRYRRLTRYVPGTKQAPRAWYLTIREEMEALGGVRSKLDPCLFYFPDETNQDWEGFLVFHVDDFSGGGSNEWCEKMKVDETRSSPSRGAT